MSAVSAERNTEAALAEEIREADALIVRGKIDDACSALESAIEKAIVLQDVTALEEIRDLADDILDQTLPSELAVRDRCRALHHFAEDYVVAPDWERPVSEVMARLRPEPPAPSRPERETPAWLTRGCTATGRLIERALRPLREWLWWPSPPPPLQPAKVAVLILALACPVAFMTVLLVGMNLSEENQIVLLPLLIFITVTAAAVLLFGLLGLLAETIEREEDQAEPDGDDDDDSDLAAFIWFLLLVVPAYSLLLWFSITSIEDILRG